MSQPKWKFAGHLGDCNPLNYGGLMLFVDETGVHSPELVSVARYFMYTPVIFVTRTVICGRCTVTAGVLSDNPYRPDHPAWFADSIPAVAGSEGDTAENLIRLLTSDDPATLAAGYRSLGEYHGYSEFDHDPPDEFDDAGTLPDRVLRVLLPAAYARRLVSRRWPECADMPDGILRDWMLDQGGEWYDLALELLPLTPGECDR